MKRKLVSVLLSVSLVAAMVMGCSNGDGDKKSSSTKTESTSNKKGGHKFGYTCMDGTNPFFVTLEDEIRKKVEANGDELVSVDPANDVSLQVQQVEDLISQGIDAMFLNPAEAEGILPALDALKEANIPIVNFDTEVADMSYATSYVGSDNYNAGKVCGEDLVKKCPKGGDIIVLDSPTMNSIVDRTKGFTDGELVENVSFELRKGEILGFAGLVGAGRSEVMKSIFGLMPKSTGDIYLEGKKVTINSPIDAMKNGIALVPENRKLEGLYLVQSVRFNSTIEVLNEFIKGIFVDNSKEREITQEYIDKMATKTPSQEQAIGNLSGGNQQKVLIGRWLATHPKILILDEPTRGVDVGAKSEIYAIMNKLAKQGMSIIMISSELPEILGMSDRIYIMAHGKMRGCISHKEATQESVMMLAAE